MDIFKKKLSPYVINPEISKKGAFSFNILKRFIPQKITDFEIAIFFQQFSVLISAGLPIIHCCDTLIANQKNILFSRIITSIKNELETGKSLNQALSKFHKYFDIMTCSIIDAGERSGTLDIMLKQIAINKEKKVRLKNQINKVTFYPTILFIFAIGITIFMLIFIIPRFRDLFNAMDAKLPSITLLIINFSNILQKFYWIFLIPILGFGILMNYFKSSKLLKKYFDIIILRIPIFKILFNKIIFIRFVRNLATLLASDIPINDALNIVAKISNNYIYEKAILKLKENIFAGIQLHKGMELNPLFSAFSIKMIRIGEDSGSIEKMLEKIADFYEEDIDRLINNLGQLLEPLIIFLLGVLITALIIAMYLPIFKLGTII